MAIETGSLPIGDSAQPVVWRDGHAVDRANLWAHAVAVAETFGDADHLINLCEDRGNFLIGFCAGLIAGKPTLLPPSRATRVVAEIRDDYARSLLFDDVRIDEAASNSAAAPLLPVIDPSRIVAIGFTSGSTGKPTANAKTWGAFVGSNQRNSAAFARFAPASMNIVATVPSQHMYGMETCVLLPLLSDMAIAVDRPLFPQDLAVALARVPAPRMLVTTPVHLRAFIDAGIPYPEVALIVSATAPLPTELATAAETVFKAPLLEVFGSTETCVIARRRTAIESDWRLHPGIRLEPLGEEGTLVHAPYFAVPVRLQDCVRTTGDDRIVVEGRCQDMIEIAGKRASLGDISARLQAVAGVHDAVALQSIEVDAAGVRRVEAFIVAASVDDATILAALKQWLDPVFLPRRIHRVERLPRNETGKLRRDDMVALQEHSKP
jgi:acyl-coenzyme A synthetase/AMP-(fatty) acid ligase